MDPNTNTNSAPDAQQPKKKKCCMGACCKCKPTKVMRDNCMKSNDNSEESC